MNGQAPLHVLIADDSEAFRNYLALALAQEYHVSTSRDGQECMARYAKARPDILVLDMDMPRAGGLDVIHHLRDICHDAETYILVLTGLGQKELKSRALNAGANDYLLKPCDMEELMARMGVAERQIRLSQETQRAYERIRGEIRMVADLQRRLLPTSLPELPGVRLTARYTPSGQASGDYYDCFVMDDGRLRVAVADVAGHGARAAFLMAVVRTLFRLSKDTDQPLADCMAEINDQLCLIIGTESDFVTMFAADIDLPARRVEWINAGHCPALLSEGGPHADELCSHVPALGFVRTPFQSNNARLPGGFSLFLYTDGFYEREVAPGLMFTLNRFLDMAKDRLARGSLSLDELDAALAAECDQADLRDDLAALLIDFTPPGSVSGT